MNGLEEDLPPKESTQYLQKMFQEELQLSPKIESVRRLGGKGRKEMASTSNVSAV